MLFGCSAATKEETYDMLQQSTEIELEYAVPDYDTTEDSAVELLPWLQLGSLETHPELRSAFEEYLNITGETGNKEGTLYYNPETQQAEQNVTLYMATKNSAISSYFANIDAMTKLGEIATENYTDIEADDINAPYATINAYFELLPDQTDGQFDGDATISRAQAMALVMRATNQVNEAQAPETNNDFTSVVGESQYTNFAAPMNEYSYLNTSNGLTEQSFNGTMTKGEYIALVTNYIRADYLATLEEWGYTDLYSDASDVTISTVSDAGNIKYSEAISDASKGVPTDLYETFKLAIKNGYLAEADLEDWDSALTKAEAVSLFITMATNANSTYGLYSDYITPDSVLEDKYSDVVIKPDVEPTYEEAQAAGKRENAEVREAWADKANGGSAITAYSKYAVSQGADGTDGWTWEYIHGQGAGNQPSYAVYMKEGDPLYGTVYHVGDYLPSGTQFCGTLEEFGAWQDEQFYNTAEQNGIKVEEKEDGTKVIVID